MIKHYTLNNKKVNVPVEDKEKQEIARKIKAMTPEELDTHILELDARAEGLFSKKNIKASTDKNVIATEVYKKKKWVLVNKNPKKWS